MNSNPFELKGLTHPIKGFEDIEKLAVTESVLLTVSQWEDEPRPSSDALNETNKWVIQVKTNTLLTGNIIITPTFFNLEPIYFNPNIIDNSFDIQYPEFMKFNYSTPEMKLKIQAYLIKCPDLISIVKEAYNKAFEEFQGANLILDLDDEDNHHQELVLLIRPSQYDEGFMDHVDTFREPFMEKMVKTDGWFFITTDFQ